MPSPSDDPRRVPIPRTLREAAHVEGRVEWLESVAFTVAAVAERWSLTVGAPFEPGGHTAWVAPASSAAFGPVVLKVGWRHPESEHEADGLEQWNGDGAVRIHTRDERDDTIVLLIERCVPGVSLGSRPEAEQDAVIAGLLPRLWREPDPGRRFRPLQVMCDQWADRYERNAPGQRRLDPGIIEAGVSLFRMLPAGSTRNVVLCTDLHAGNVLAAEREPWLVIDPKPYVGDPTYDALQHMLNCTRRLAADPDGFARHIGAQLELDADRLRMWLFARCVIESDGWPGLADVARRLAP